MLDEMERLHYLDNRKQGVNRQSFGIFPIQNYEIVCQSTLDWRITIYYACMCIDTYPHACEYA